MSNEKLDLHTISGIEEGIKRLVIDLPFKIHKEIKDRSMVRNVSMKTWVMRAIQMAIIEEDKRK